jgi:hypothetical protein
MTETSIRDAIMRELKDRPRCWAWVKHQTGRGVRGIPDIEGCYRSYMLAWEVKPPGRLVFRPGQLLQLQLAADAGACAAVVTSRVEAAALLDAIDHVPPVAKYTRDAWTLWFGYHGLQHMQPPPPR